MVIQPGQVRDDFIILPPGTFASSIRASHAKTILAAVCGTTLDNLPQRPSALQPSLSFFACEALDHVITDCIENGIGEDVLADAIAGSEGAKMPEGSSWVPLHLISFCASFVSVLLSDALQNF